MIKNKFEANGDVRIEGETIEEVAAAIRALARTIERCARWLEENYKGIAGEGTAQADAMRRALKDEK